MSNWPGFMTREQVADLFRWMVRGEFLNLSEAAQHYGVSVAMVSAVQNGKKAPNKDMLKDLGVEKVTGYRMEEKT